MYVCVCFSGSLHLVLITFHHTINMGDPIACLEMNEPHRSTPDAGLAVLSLAGLGQSKTSTNRTFLHVYRLETIPFFRVRALTFDETMEEYMEAVLFLILIFCPLGSDPCPLILG